MLVEVADEDTTNLVVFDEEGQGEIIKKEGSCVGGVLREKGMKEGEI